MNVLPRTARPERRTLCPCRLNAARSTLPSRGGSPSTLRLPRLSHSSRRAILALDLVEDLVGLFCGAQEWSQKDSRRLPGGTSCLVKNSGPDACHETTSQHSRVQASASLSMIGASLSKPSKECEYWSCCRPLDQHVPLVLTGSAPFRGQVGPLCCAVPTGWAAGRGPADWAPWR